MSMILIVSPMQLTVMRNEFIFRNIIQLYESWIKCCSDESFYASFFKIVLHTNITKLEYLWPAHQHLLLNACKLNPLAGWSL